MAMAVGVNHSAVSLCTIVFNNTSLDFAEEHELPKLLGSSVIARTNLCEVDSFGVVGHLVVVVDVLVNVLLVDREESEGEDPCVEIAALTTGEDGSLNVLALAEPDVMNLSGDISAGRVGGQGSLILPVSRYGDLVKAIA